MYLLVVGVCCEEVSGGEFGDMAFVNFCLNGSLDVWRFEGLEVRRFEGLKV